ncbi:hypothetical protein ATANTOWER_027005 [Ataeniobius toweri]|uniref:Uncharacterized protein n=1 Tax=Ataeniobius toweri TaxID=208326 RepID=A0ABU7ABU7_9TELE|nr:hypothetical protein [Ataeniobius toweri]
MNLQTSSKGSQLDSRNLPEGLLRTVTIQRDIFNTNHKSAFHKPSSGKNQSKTEESQERGRKRRLRKTKYGRP